MCDETSIKSDYVKLLDFLERSEVVFQHAILSTPTGVSRNQFTDLNIERMQFIVEGAKTTIHLGRLHSMLDKMVTNEDARDEMSCDDTRFGDTTDTRNDLVREIVKLMKE